MSRVFILHPRDVISKNDGQRHFIGYQALIRLYGLKVGECIDGRLPVNRLDGSKEYTELLPRHDGDYREHLTVQCAGNG